MITQVEVAETVYNNARWCEAVCRAHGCPGEFHEALWLNRHRVPRFYPNAITLTNGPDHTEQLALIQRLIAKGTLRQWAVKDSFATLDLAALGFQVLFEATWLWRAPELAKPSDVVPGTQWGMVRDEAELARWEAAWAGSADPAATPRTFPATLLAEAHTVFFAARQGAQVVGGLIAHRTDGVVGVSNVFAPESDLLHFWAGGLAAVMAAFPGMPLVDYEHGPMLTLAKALGFVGMGPLRVWVRA